MAKTTYIVVPAQFRFVKPCADCPLFKRWSLMVLFVILWARPPRPSEWPTLKPLAAGVGSLPPRAAQGHRCTIRPVLVLVEACPPSPRSQPRPAPAPLFCAAPSLAICPPFGYPRRRRLRRPVASKGARLCRRRLRRREGRWGGSGPVLASGAGRSGLRGCVVLPLWQVFTNVIHNCKPVQRQRAPVKYYGGLPPSSPPFLPHR